MSELTRTDLLAILSRLTDLATGQAEGFAARSAALALRLCEAAGHDRAARAAAFHQALLRYIGCNADTWMMAALFGDEMAFRRDFARIDAARLPEMAGVIAAAVRRSQPDASPAATALAVVGALARGRSGAPAILAGHCEVAERLALRLGLGAGVAATLGQLYERWDGKGQPKGLKGSAVAPAVRVVTLAQDTLVLVEAHGRSAALDLVAGRRGTVYDPALVELFLPLAPRLLDGLETSGDRPALARLDPSAPVPLVGAALDEACLVLADMTDMRLAETAGHSRAVAKLAEAAARRLRLGEAEVALARRAGLVHDLGECAVPVALWCRPGALSQAERDRAELHPYHGERLLAGPPALAAIAAVVGRHHERLDGSGYHRGCRAADLTPVDRILAAAEAFQSWTEARPHRPALRPEAAAARLNALIRSGAICPEAGAAVLAEAGQRAATPNGTSGLTPRELEVLRHLAAGSTVKGVARALGIAPKTADNHAQNLYGKLGVTTRAAAVLWAVERGLHRAGGG